MKEYIKTFSGETSVKNIQLLTKPTPTHAGLADMTNKGVFSVFDYGTIEPRIPLDNSTVALMSGFNFELSKEQGIDSHYSSMVNHENEPITARESVEVEYAPSTMRVIFVNRIKPEHTEQGWDYSWFQNPEYNNHIHPIEFMARNELNNKFWDRIEKGPFTHEDFELPEDMQRGDSIPNDSSPVLDYSTKFEPEDRYVRKEDVLKMLGISQERFDHINQQTTELTRFFTKYAESQGFQLKDHKVEYITYAGNHDCLGDAIVNWHEARLSYGSFQISKQLIRDEMVFLNEEWYADINRAKELAKAKGHPDFRKLMNKSIKPILPEVEFWKKINTLFQAGTNKWVNAKVYPVFSERKQTLANDLEQAIEEFDNVRKA